MTVLERLVSDLSKRQLTLRADRNIYTHYLKEVDPQLMINIAYPQILKGIETQGTMINTVAGIGRRLRQSLKMSNDVIADAQVGWFITISFIECGVLFYKLKHTYKAGKKSKYPAYFFAIKDWKAIKELWTLVDTEKIDLFPSKTQYGDWSGPLNDEGYTIIKKGHSSALAQFGRDDKGMLYDVLNKLQSVGWRINKDLLLIYQYYLHRDDPVNPFKLYAEIDPEKRASLMIEAEAIYRIALANQDNVFYHSYNFDFRGRVYVNTAFLHEQGSDNAKGLLLLEQGVPLGANGLYWLKVHTSNCFGNDKVTLNDRTEFVDKHLDLFISYAEKPIVNQGWIETDSALSFLAACNELKKIRDWVVEGGKIEDYVCHLPVYIDGSNNGVQHLVAMSQDEDIAPLVNLVPQDLPGDVYMYIAKFTWEKINQMVTDLPEDAKGGFEDLFDTAKRLQKDYFDAPDKSEEKSIAYHKAQEWRNNNRSKREKLFPVYWSKITDPKEQRKICKRNVMTLG